MSLRVEGQERCWKIIFESSSISSSHCFFFQEYHESDMADVYSHIVFNRTAIDVSKFQSQRGKPAFSPTWILKITWDHVMPVSYQKTNQSEVTSVTVCQNTPNHKNNACIKLDIYLCVLEIEHITGMHTKAKTNIRSLLSFTFNMSALLEWINWTNAPPWGRFNERNTVYFLLPCIQTTYCHLPKTKAKVIFGTKLIIYWFIYFFAINISIWWV